MLRIYSEQEVDAAMAYLRELRPDIYKAIIYNEITYDSQEALQFSEFFRAMKEGQFIGNNTTDISRLLFCFRKRIHKNIAIFQAEFDSMAD